MSPSHQTAASRNARFARARSAISLGAAFALFCAVFTGYDLRASRAAGGLIDELFGPSAQPHKLYYDGYAPRSEVSPREGGRRARHARKARAHYAQARRQLVERRKFALARRAAPVEQRRGGAVEALSPTRNASFKVAASSGAVGGVSRRAVCVRACDGYYFPALAVSRASQLAAQQASCEKLCPGAQSTLFVFPEGSDKVDEAKAAKSGETYAALLARLDLNDSRAKSCSCQTEATAAAATRALLTDSTLRPGDSVVTPQGVRIVRRGSRFPFKETDFLSLAESGNVPLSNKSALYAIEKALKTPQGRLAVMNGERRHGGRPKSTL
ncbi:DUF2865 domain-containing protein [Methylocystis parvus]|uniref:DUF2865 domain-containing protein n=1 Tax=Methylocystis parvus TaxID=134 RepID=A0A6B8M9Z9_9HYPH|nr:DUF2865 domain-containing protein [Methylocystis parvus]QGM99255.1 DUF2865 domain-containing protein [Methylocystis parvus]WBK00362.1 DUF2865 domain-containing protein [Methylocystis parvus OBBP]